MIVIVGDAITVSFNALIERNDMNLTEHQREVLKALLSDKSKIVHLKGAGGVGKSHTISQWVSTLRDDSYALTGTTNKAVCNVLEMTGKDNGQTIHSFLGFSLKNDNEGDYTLIKKRNFKPRKVEYLIIDESSMMTRQLISEVEKFIKYGYITKKVILVGDEVQLVIDKFLNLDRYPSFELKQQMRQKEKNSLTETLSKLRVEIETNGKPFEIKEEKGVIELFDNHVNFLKAYKASTYNKVIIAYTNKVVTSYNKNIKKYIFNHNDVYNAGDLIYPLSPVINNERIVIKNREVVEIEKVKLNEDGVWIIKTTNNSIIKVPPTKTWLNERLKPLAEEKRWIEYYRIKEMYNFVHHTFAGTCHSLQGTSVDEVWIDYSDFEPPNDSLGFEKMRLLYVALSRARIKANIFFGNTRNYKGLQGV